MKLHIHECASLPSPPEENNTAYIQCLHQSQPYILHTIRHIARPHVLTTTITTYTPSLVVVNVLLSTIHSTTYITAAVHHKPLSAEETPPPSKHEKTHKHAQIRVVRCVPAATLLAGWMGLFLVPASLVDPPQPGRPNPTRRRRRRHSHSHRRQNPATHLCQPERPGLRRTVPPTQKEMDPAPTA